MEANLLSIHATSASDLDVLGLEQSPHFEVDVWTGSLPRCYGVVSIKLGLEDIGFFSRRRRFLAWAYNQRRLVWLGPPEDSNTEEFLRTFASAVMCEADDLLWQDVPSERELAYIRPAEAKGFFCGLERLRERGLLNLPSLLPPYQKEFCDKYLALYRGDRQGCRGSFVVDATQDPEQRPRCGAWFPAFSRSSAVFSLSSSELFTSNERDYAMCFPSLNFEACR